MERRPRAPRHGLLRLDRDHAGHAPGRAQPRATRSSSSSRSTRTTGRAASSPGPSPSSCRSSRRTSRFDPDRLARAVHAAHARHHLQQPEQPVGQGLLPRASSRSSPISACEHDLLAITDEIYEHIVYDGAAAHPRSPRCRAWRTGPSRSRASRSPTRSPAGGSATRSPARSSRSASGAPTTSSRWARPHPLQEAAVTALNLPDSYYVAPARGLPGAAGSAAAATSTKAGFIAFKPQGAYYILTESPTSWSEYGCPTTRRSPCSSSRRWAWRRCPARPSTPTPSSGGRRSASASPRPTTCSSRRASGSRSCRPLTARAAVGPRHLRRRSRRRRRRALSSRGARSPAVAAASTDGRGSSSSGPARPRARWPPRWRRPGATASPGASSRSRTATWRRPVASALVEAGHPVPDERGAAAARGILRPGRGRDSRRPGPVPHLGRGLGPHARSGAAGHPRREAGRDAAPARGRRHYQRAERRAEAPARCSRAASWPAPPRPRRVHALLLSDVIGDPLDVIASGPTAPDPIHLRRRARHARPLRRCGTARPAP